MKDAEKDLGTGNVARGWKPTAEAPDGRTYWRLRDESGTETIGRRSMWNDTGWCEYISGRQLRPVEFAPVED